MLLATTISLEAVIAAYQAPPMFSAEDKAAAATYWSAPGRYSVRPPQNFRDAGLWQVRLTVAGSTWLWTFNKARGVAMKPTTDITGNQERDKAWDEWIGKKFEYDRWLAGQIADAANQVVLGRPASILDSSVPTEEPPFPGPMPEDMLAFVQQPYVSESNGFKSMTSTTSDPGTQIGTRNSERETIWVQEKRVLAVTSATSLTTESVIDTTYTGVKYVISDALDVEPSGMWFALMKMSEAALARNIRSKDYLEREAAAVRAIRQSLENEQRTMMNKAAVVGAFMPTITTVTEP